MFSLPALSHVGESKASASVNLIQPAHIDTLVKDWLTRPELKNSLVGLEIMELPSGQILSAVNGNKRFVPASVAKVLTCACALESLGADFRYTTKFLAYGPVKKDKLAGDLVVDPAQDPSLTSQDIRKMLETLQTKGIKHIEGKLKLLPINGGFNHFSPSWLAEDWSQDWMPVSSNLVIDHNVVPAKDPGQGIRVQSQSLEAMDNALLQTLLKSNLTAGWVSYDKSSDLVHICRAPSPSMSNAGTLNIANPDDYNLAVISHMIKAIGVRLTSRGQNQLRREEPQVVAEHQSQPLREIIKRTLRESDNLYAQQLLRTLGVKARNADEQKDTLLEEDGLKFLNQWLANLGIARQEVLLWDGCGLSRKNCISAHALNIVLRHMAGEKLDGLFFQLLRSQGPARSDAGSFEFKTGTMDSVRSIAGVIWTRGKGALAVSILINAHTQDIRDLKVAISSLINQLEAMPKLGAQESRPLNTIRGSIYPRRAGTKHNNTAGIDKRATHHTGSFTDSKHKKHRHT